MGVIEVEETALIIQNASHLRLENYAKRISKPNEKN